MRSPRLHLAHLSVAALLLCVSTARSQQPATADPGAQLQGLLEKKQAALQSGDADGIVAASRSLAAFALGLAAEIESTQANTAQALKDNQISFALMPAPAVGMQLMMLELKAGQRDGAASVEKQLAETLGDTANLHELLAGAHYGGGDLDGAIGELERAVALDANSFSSHLTLGMFYWELNEYGYNADSLREFDQAQKLNPSDFHANFYDGTILSQYHRYADAAVRLHAATEEDTSDPDPWVQIGMDAFAQNKPEEARVALERAVASTGSDVGRNSYQVRRVYAVLNRLSMEAGDRASAAKFADEAARADKLAGAQEGSSNLSESVAVNASSNTAAFRKPALSKVSAVPPVSEKQQQSVLELRTIAAQSLNDAGTAFARNRNYADAFVLFQHAAEVQPTLVPVMRNLGLAAFHLQDYQAALTALSAAVGQDPSDALAQKYLEQTKVYVPGAK